MTVIKDHSTAHKVFPTVLKVLLATFGFSHESELFLEGLYCV